MSLNDQHRVALQVVVVTAAVDSALGVAFGITDHVGISNGLYFAVVTATTVGYGDILPHGWAPHLIAVLMMLTVIPLFASTFSLLTTGLTADHVDARHKELKAKLDRKQLQ